LSYMKHLSKGETPQGKGFLPKGEGATTSKR
jgi:hypothetical protein